MAKRVVALCPILLFFVLLWVRQTPLTGAAAAPFTQVIVQANQGAWGNNLGDLDGDGDLDIIEGGGDLGGNVYWYVAPAWQRFQIGSDGGGDDLQVGDINRDGAPDVVVNGSGKIVWYENPRGTGGNVQGLWTKHTVDSTRQSHDIVITDLNRDGKLDILIRLEEGATYYYLQGATADAWTRFQISQAPNGHGGLEVGDINRDGRPDIVENGFWLEGPADPATGAWIKHDIVSWTQGSSAAIHDINHDGRLDIFLAVSESGPGSLAWFEAPVDPVNGTWVRHNIDTVEDVHRFFLIDVNKDGTEDLVFAEMHQAAGKRVGVYYNNGLGASWTLNTLSTQGSHNIAVGDIGNDGDIDIVGSNWSTNAPDGGAQKIWRNDLNSALPTTNWTYIQADNTRQQNLTFGLTAGDIDEDGWPDILSGEYWYRNPKADLTGAWARTSIGPYDGLFLMDVDDDGNVDVLAQRMVTGTQVGFFRLTPNASFTSWTPLQVGSTPPTHPTGDHWSAHGFRLGQIAPGGKPEIVLTSERSIYYFQVPANPAIGNWPRVEITDGFWGQSDVEIVDIDGDGDLDAIGFYAEQALGWWENPGTGASMWTRHDIGTTPNQMGGRIAVADFNGDGRKDVAVSEANFDTSGNGLYWFQCPASALTPNWTRRTILTNLGSVHSLEVGDFDQNGRPDLMTGTHRGTLQGLILKSADFGITWTTQIVNSGFESHIGMRPFDLDRDGDLDIISQAWDDFQFLHIWRNNAIGSSGGDVTPPQITAVSSSNISATSAQINWTTNEPADSKVDYGPTTQYGSSVTLVPLVGGHVVPLSGLTQGTLYHYRVTSKDASNNSAASGDFTFTTSTSDTTAPQISNISVNPLAATSATVNWTTNEPADGRVRYGTTSNYGSTTTLQPALVLNHAISLMGLSGNTQYHFRINTRDASGNLAQSSNGTFMTPAADVTPPTVSITAPAGGASVVGTINVTASAGDNVGVVGVQFQLDGAAFGAELTSGPFTTAWNTTLSSNGSHTWRAVARDAAGNTTTSDPVTVTVSNVAPSVAHRQSNGATNNATATSMAVGFGSSTLAGNLIVAAVSMGGASSMTCSDNQGNVYTNLPVQYDSVNDQALGICYAPNIKAGATTVTVSFGVGAYYRRLIIHEYAGLAQVNPVDVTAANIANGTTAANSITTTAATTTAANQLIFAAVMDDAGATNIQAGTGFTMRASVNGSDLATEDRMQPAAGSIAGTFTFGTAHRYLARMVAFKTGAPGDTTLPDVSVTAPSGGATVSGNVQLTATASDNVGVVGLQFKVGGVNVGAEITNGNYNLLWDSTTVGNGQRIITAVARDAAGNTRTSANVTVSVNNVDATPPNITGVNVTGIGATGATVGWTTNENATTQVRYGPDTTYAFSTTLNPALTTGHSQPLSGLSPGTTYFFQVLSTDGSGNTGSAASSFTTAAGQDTTPPVLSSVNVTNVTSSSATINWATNEPADGRVEYGTTTTYGVMTPLQPAFVTNHAIPLTGLSPGTLYHFRIHIRDAAGNLAQSADGTFTTPGALPVAHRQSNGATNNATATSIAVGFGSSTLAGNLIVAAVSMGGASSMTCSDNQANVYTNLPVQYDSVNDQALGICYAPNIKAGATTVTVSFGVGAYYRRLIIHEYAGLAQVNPVDVTAANIANGTTAANSITTTAATTTAANQLIFAAVMDDAGATNIQAGTGFTMRASVNGSDLATEDRMQPAAGSIAGTFTFGTAHRYLARMVAFKTGAPGDTTLPDVSVTAPSGGTTVSGNVQLTASASDNVGVVGLQFRVGGVNVGAEITNGNYNLLWNSTTVGNGQRVITAVARDAAGNTRTSADVTVSVNNVDATPPNITGVNVTGIGATGATVGWTTNENATTQVRYGPDTTYAFSTTLNPALTTGHSQPLSGLSPGTTYFFQVLSTDGSGNTGSAASSFTTAAGQDTTPPVLSSVNVTNVTSSSATINWATNEPADGRVEYGTTTTYGVMTPLQPAFVTNHAIPLTGLSPGTLYHFRIHIRDAAGNLAQSADGTFTTPGALPVAHRQSNGATNNATATSIAVGFGSSTLAGNLIVAAVSMGGASSMTCSDNQGNTYTSLPVQYDTANDQALGICYAPNIKAGATTVTASFGVGAYYRRLIVHEYSGLAQVNPVDVTAANIANGTTAANNITTTAATTTSANDLIFAVVMSDSGLTNIQAGTGFTLRASLGGSDLATEDRVQSAAGPIAGTFTFGNANRYLARVVAFKSGAPAESVSPEVSVTAPSGGTTVSGNVQQTAAAPDNAGVGNRVITREATRIRPDR